MEHNDTRITDRLGERFDELRDRLAAVVAGDEVRHEIAGLRHSVANLDRTATTLGERLDTHGEHVDRALERLGERIDRSGRSWLGRLLWLALGASVGAAATALLDPESGARRRRIVRERAAAEAEHLADETLRLTGRDEQSASEAGLADPHPAIGRRRSGSA